MPLALPLLVVLLTQAPPTPAPIAQAPTASTTRWSSTTDIELVADERDSLKGVSRLALTVNLPDALASVLGTAPVTSTIAFQLEQAGLEVTTRRAVEDPLLAVTVRVVAERDGPRERAVYRVYADLLQLVRLADYDGRTRLMMASTWHAGSFGMLTAAVESDLRARIEEVVEAFLADHRAANAPAQTAPALTPVP